MPRKLRIPKRRTPRRPSLRDFSIREQLMLLTAWSPGSDAAPRSPWSTWEEYLDDYRAVRAEVLERFARVPFAEKALLLHEAEGPEVLASSCWEDIDCYPDGWTDEPA